MSKSDWKSTLERREDILNSITQNGKVYVQELSDKYQVSSVTIRNDLEILDNKGLILKTRGGALKTESRVRSDQSISEKYHLNIQQKRSIGKLAAREVNDNETIIIDSGSTTEELCKHLSDKKDLTIITNAINIANIVMHYPNVNLIIPGGYLRKNSNSLIGPLAESNLKNLYADKAFLGVDGLDTTKGLYTPNIEEAHLNQKMIEITKEVIVLVDASKFRKKSLALICALNKVDKIITDSGIDTQDRKNLEDVGIKVLD